MTRRTNAKAVGFAFLVYIAAALSGMILSSRAASGEGIAARLAGIAHHAPIMRLAVVLGLVGCFCALDPQPGVRDCRRGTAVLAGGIGR